MLFNNRDQGPIHVFCNLTDIESSAIFYHQQACLWSSLSRNHCPTEVLSKAIILIVALILSLKYFVVNDIGKLVVLFNIRPIPEV